MHPPRPIHLLLRQPNHLPLFLPSPAFDRAMCSLAPRAGAAAPDIGATAFLDRQRGVVAAAMAAPAATSRHNAGEPTTTRRARASEAKDAEASAARKRGRHEGSEHVVVHPAAASSSALRSRMDKELVALQGLIKRAKLLPHRSTDPSAEKKPVPVPAPRRSEPPPVVSSAAKRTTASQAKAATDAPPASSKHQQCPVRGAAAKNPTSPQVPNKQRPSEAPAKQKQQQSAVVQRAAAAKTTEVPEKRRPEEGEKELARGAIVVWNSTREEFRQMLLEVEKAALPDETVYPEEMEALGIPFEFVVTRTWKQAMLEDYGKIVECS